MKTINTPRCQRRQASHRNERGADQCKALAVSSVSRGGSLTRCVEGHHRRCTKELTARVRRGATGNPRRREAQAAPLCSSQRRAKGYSKSGHAHANGLGAPRERRLGVGLGEAFFSRSLAEKKHKGQPGPILFSCFPAVHSLATRRRHNLFISTASFFSAAQKTEAS